MLVTAAGIAVHETDPTRFPNPWRGLWWAIVTVTTVGYGDTFPTSPLGRVVAAFLMVVGIGFLGLATAAIACHFVNEDAEDKHREATDKQDQILAELRRVYRPARPARSTELAHDANVGRFVPFTNGGAGVSSQGAGLGRGPLLRGPPLDTTTLGPAGRFAGSGHDLAVAGDPNARSPSSTESTDRARSPDPGRVSTRGGPNVLPAAVPLLAGGGCHGHCSRPQSFGAEISPLPAAESDYNAPMLRGRSAGIAAALAIATLAAVAAGCGGGSGGPALSLDPVAAAATKTEQAGAARIRFSMSAHGPRAR